MGYKAMAFIRRDFQTQASYRLDFAMRVGGILISIAVFYFISQILGTAVNPYLQEYGTDYFHFALIALAFFPFIGISTNSLAEIIQQYQQDGTLEMLFLSPTPILPTLLMSTLWRYCWALAEALFYLLAASLIFGAQLAWANLLDISLILVFIILANTGLGLINVGFVLVTKRPSPLVQLLGLVTTLLGGMYYPIKVLPQWLRFFSYLIPATYSFDALRRTMLPDTSLLEVGQDMLALGIFTLVLLPLGLVAFHYAVRWAKMDGSLSQF